ncbi:MAG: hypothetical protein LBU34_13515 [Planctomycetaceae bacterium]|nr:hypothetical protein [Planctomycetaceae bacterium]
MVATTPSITQETLPAFLPTVAGKNVAQPSHRQRRRQPQSEKLTLILPLCLYVDFYFVKVCYSLF